MERKIDSTNQFVSQARKSTLPSADRLQQLAISESGFIFDPVSGHSFSVNETGIIIVRLLQQGKDLPAAIAELQNSYSEQAATIERDLMEFISLLREQVDSTL